MSVFFPSYFRIYEKNSDRWYVLPGQKFFSQSNLSLEQGKLEARYGMTISEIVQQFFALARGRSGFYLADLKHRQFYFCGQSADDVRHTLWQLGITRPDPTV